MVQTGRHKLVTQNAEPLLFPSHGACRISKGEAADPFHLTLVPQDVSNLKHIAHTFVSQSVPDLVGVDVDGTRVMTETHSALVHQVPRFPPPAWPDDDCSPCCACSI